MEYIRTFTREFDVGDEAQVSIESRSGTVTVRGDETQRVRVEVIARLWADNDVEADEQADLILRGIQQGGKRVTVRAPTLLRPRPFILFGRGPRIDYQVTAPRATTATITSRSGRVEVEELAGPLEIEARSGRVAVRDIGSDTKIASRSGSVQADVIAGSLALESRSGGVKVSRCEGDVTVRSRSGSLQIEEVGGALKIETRSGSVRYDGDVRGPFDIDVTSGSVRLAVNPKRSFFLDAESSSGSVRSDLPLRRAASAAPSPRERGPTVRIRTRSGSIHIVPR
jgi:DUF4097 and DUF4098 domain-containing protein YvlB